jgi:hypothetical protein
MLLLMLMACASDHKEESEEQPTVLNIYVYSPGHPIVTRSDAPDVQVTDSEENTIYSLQLWVFKHSDGTLIKYYKPESVENLNNGSGATYQLKMDDDFVTNKPDVDVYILANAEEYSYQFGENTSRAALDAAVLSDTQNDNAFGLTALTTSLTDKGVPMSGVLKNQPVVGDAPILRIKSQSADEMARVKLARAVSKVRFIFSKASGDNEPTIRIMNIQLDGAMIPNEECLFLKEPYDGTNVNIPNNVVYESGSFLSDAFDITANCMNPRDYEYRESWSGQTYEDKIVEGLTKKNDDDTYELEQQGPFYLRESDKQLKGTITYKIIPNGTTDEEAIAAITPKEATFEMANAGEFSRNHTWTVYAYFAGGSRIQVISVYVMTWNLETLDDVDRKVHNW